MIILLKDLRFFIGLFFSIIGLMLSLQGSFNPIIIADCNLNLWVGLSFLLFSVLTLSLVAADFSRKS